MLSLSLCLRTKTVEQNPHNCQARPNPSIFCGIRRLISMWTTARKWIISPDKLKHSAPSFLRPVSINPAFSVWVLQVGFFHQIFQPSLCMDFSFLPNIVYPIHVIVLHFVTWMTFGADYTLWSTSCRSPTHTAPM
jgi:hypothetical protein